MLENDLIGLDETEAIAKIKIAGLEARVTRKDAERFMGTTDRRIDRINLEIDNGKVTNAHRG